MKKSMRLRSKIILALLAMLLSGITVYAKTTNEKITDVQQQMEETQQQINENKNSITGLEDSKNQLSGSLNSLNNQFIEITGNLEELENQLTAKATEIEKTKVALAEAKATEEAQYEAMKKRIRFMYEKGDVNYVTLFFESENMSDLLNKSEYVKKIAEYDRNMLTKYQETKELIAETEKSLEQEEADLQVLQEETAQKQEQVSGLVATTSSKLSQNEDELEVAYQKALAYEAQLNAQRNTLEDLEREKAAEAAAAATAGTAPAEAANASDLQLLAAIIQCEADGEPYDGKIAVGNVVMNRVKSPRYANTVVGVLFQKYQFTPVTSGRFLIVLARGANSTCTQAAQDVLNGANVVGDVLHFRTVVDYITGQVIGNHVFY